MRKSLLDSTSIYRGAILTKEAPADIKTAEAALEHLTTELGSITGMLEKSKQDMEKQYTDLHSHYDGIKADNDELKETVKKHVADYAEYVTKHQMLQQALDQVKKELDAPIIKGGKDLEDSDRRAAIELQKRSFLSKGGNEFEFVEDTNNLVCAKDYRSAVRKLTKVGIESKAKILRTFTEAETKAFEMSSLDSALFSPEMLGIELDCIIECAELLDLYGSVSVSKTTFMYPQVTDYGAIGQYDCDAKCDAEYGPEGNIIYKNGAVSDFRGVFCLQRKVLQEANYDLLNFMFRAAARSHRINRNRALITGDGVNEPLGWATADCFTRLKTGGTTFNHQDWRLFLSSAPVEYGPIVSTMHQNTFAFLAAQLDGAGRFIFGEGQMTYSPSQTGEAIRISNCLPDPTKGLTLNGTAAAPFITGDFIAAAGAWNVAYYMVNKRPLWMEIWEGQSSAWCVKYQFGAEDGSFIGCCPAVRVLTVGP